MERPILFNPPMVRALIDGEGHAVAGSRTLPCRIAQEGDRGALLAEVDRLTAALADAQKQAAAWEVLAQDRSDLLQRLRGGLVALGKAWAAAGYPPLPELEWLQKETP